MEDPEETQEVPPCSALPPGASVYPAGPLCAQHLHGPASCKGVACCVLTLGYLPPSPVIPRVLVLKMELQADSNPLLFF